MNPRQRTVRKRVKMWGVFHADDTLDSMWAFQDHAEHHCRTHGLHHMRPITFSYTLTPNPPSTEG